MNEKIFGKEKRNEVLPIMIWGGGGFLKFEGFASLPYRHLFKKVTNFLLKFPKKILKAPQRGYIFALMCIVIPVLLLGVKYCVDLVDYHQVCLYSGGANFYKKLAREASLAVAKHWNPGLTLKQQKESLLRIADDIYNKSPCYSGGPAHRAIPGLEVRHVSTTAGKPYDPLKLIWSDAESDTTAKIVEYESVAGDVYRSISSAYSHNLYLAVFTLYHSVYIMPPGDPLFVHEDTISDVAYKRDGSSYKPYFTIRKENLTLFKSTTFGGKTESDSSLDSVVYTKRHTPDDTKVQIWVEDDEICVQTDDDKACAVPAECNVDIILAIPVNGAACNINNADANSPTAGAGYSSSSTTPTADALQTPIHQIAQAYRAFLKNNFEFTRGVNVGLIPYAGTCCLPDHRLLQWTEQPKQFVADYFLGNQNTYQAYLRGVFLYGTCDAPITVQWEHYGINAHSFTNIMCRTGITTADPTCGNNILCSGDLLSTADPEKDATAGYSQKFRRKPALNHYLGYVNFLSMKKEKTYPETNEWYDHTPFHIVELNADVGRIRNLLNTIYPVNWARSNGNSNFLFIAVTWANNLLQDWTDDPKADAKNTTGATVEDGGHLSRPSKLTPERKKALILVVNKPDWFEPGELTYLGFDNDYSEIPMIESDKIDFSINYTDTARKFFDGSAYSGTITGSKKILIYTTTLGTVNRNSTTGFYECPDTTATGKLTFPYKYLVKIVVEPAKFHWTEQSQPMPTVNNSDKWRVVAFANNTWVAMNMNGGVTTSSDGVTFISRGAPLAAINNAGSWLGALCGSDEAPFRFIALSTNGRIAVSSDGITWERKTDLSFTNGSTTTNNLSALSTTGNWYSITWGNDRYVATHYSGHVITSENGIDWVYRGTSLTRISSEYWLGCTWDGEKFMSVCTNGYIAISPDGINWNSVGNSLSSVPGDCWHHVHYCAGVYVAITVNGSTATSVDGINWLNQGNELLDISPQWDGCMNFLNGKFLAISNGTNSSETKTASGSYEGEIGFTNVTGDTATHTINKRTEFFIEPSQMTANGITFDMKNIRLISAEITNRPYQKTNLTVSNNTAVITSTLKAPLTIRATAGTGSVTFHNDNGIEDNVGTHSVSSSTQFVFRGAPDITFANRIGKNVRDGYSSTNGVNFGHNLSQYKVWYSLNSAVITNCVLKNQVIRHYMGHYGCNDPNIKPLIINTGVPGIKQTGGAYMPIVLGTNYPACDTTDLEKVRWLNAYRDSCISDNASACRYNFSDNIAYGMVIQGVGGNYIFCIPGVPSGTLFAVLWRDNIYYFYHSSNNSDWISDGSVKLSVNWEWTSRSQLTSDSDNLYVKITTSPYQYYLVNADDKTFIPNITDEDILYNRGVGLQTLPENLSAEITAGNYIVFQGDGELHVTVKPVSQITHVKPDGVAATTNITSDQIIKISPETHLYEEQSDGTYKITLSLNNVAVSNLEPVFEYSKLRMPKMSRVIDFSQKASDGKFICNICGSESPIVDASEYFMYASKIDTDISAMGIRWNINTGNWEYYNNEGANKRSSWHHFLCMNYPGDMYLIPNVQDKNQTTPQLYFRWYRGSQATTVPQYFDGGLIRTFNIFATESSIAYSIRSYDFEIYNANDVGIPAVMAGLTMPINAVLFHGASGSTKHHYAWQSSKKVTGEMPDDGGTLLTDGGMMCDATAACRAVTTDACAKLKTDNPNLRIYVVKYRKQSQYKHKTTGTAQNFDYDYIDDCATDGNYVYDVDANHYKKGTDANATADETAATADANLAKALADIAADIKSWSGYQEAKNVR